MKIIIINFITNYSLTNSDENLFLLFFDIEFVFYYNDSCILLSNFISELFLNIMYNFKEIVYNFFTINCDVSNKNITLQELVNKLEKNQISLEKFLEELKNKQQEQKKNLTEQEDYFLRAAVSDFFKPFLACLFLYDIYAYIRDYFIWYYSDPARVYPSTKK